MMFWDRPEYKAYEPQTLKETVTTVTYTPQFKELTDEEINLIVFEIGITHIYDDPKRFARAILRKAQENGRY